ncbi:transmembrane protein 70 homolog, mitochondrial [Uranotaenia lowii]|uniref:transmembrane protein 70 homolog, mitochondrial n=1 Tax=Uranotaenia lowii TaxID=190385 RepID=UPI00247871B5|nr:transmembrane protein 70 homolog, mitochondrial [Uranotaenia lowii]
MVLLNILARGLRQHSREIASYPSGIACLKTNRQTRWLPVTRHLCSKPSDSKTESTNSDEFKVYYGILTPQIRAVKVFSLTTSLGGIIAQPVLMEQASKIGGTSVVLAVCGIAGFFTFVTPFLLHMVTKKYVTELHYDVVKQEYTASIITFLLQKQQIKFKLEDVNIPEVPGMFTTFEVKGKSLFVDPKLFPDPTHYIKIMGYDKPIDFKFEEARQNAEESSRKK